MKENEKKYGSRRDGERERKYNIIINYDNFIYFIYTYYTADLVGEIQRTLLRLF
jgi:hypothetical protein